jgi:hypothetical protein
VEGRNLKHSVGILCSEITFVMFLIFSFMADIQSETSAFGYEPH